jgi:RimJ/RimL family protein N-acetyltransferase
MRWVGDGKPISRARCEQWLVVTSNNYANRGYGMFTVVERVSNRIVGFCGLVLPGNQADPEIKYAFERGVWGRGFACEIVPALLVHGATVHGLTRIIATVAAENRASQHVLLKAGMVRGHLHTEDDGAQSVVF